MRFGAMVLGVIGGIFGLGGAAFALAVGGIGEALEVEKAGQTVWQGWAAVFLTLVGFLGAALAIVRPKLAAFLMFVAGVGGIIAVFVAYIFGGILLIIAALLAFFARRPALVKHQPGPSEQSSVGGVENASR